MWKRFLWVIAFAGAALLGFLLVSVLNPGWLFDFAQRIKYPAYYAWRDSGSAFPAERDFQLGLQTDRARKELFAGRTRSEIERMLPLLQSIPPDDTLLRGYIFYRNLPAERFAKISGSMWILEFDEAGRCVDLLMPKG